MKPSHEVGKSHLVQKGKRLLHDLCEHRRINLIDFKLQGVAISISTGIHDTNHLLRQLNCVSYSLCAMFIILGSGTIFKEKQGQNGCGKNFMCHSFSSSRT